MGRMQQKYNNEAKAMAKNLVNQSKLLGVMIENLGEKRLSVKCLNKAQELTSIACDIEKAIFIAVEARIKGV